MFVKVSCGHLTQILFRIVSDYDLLKKAMKLKTWGFGISLFLFFFAYPSFHAKSPPPLTFFSAKKGGGDLERHFDFQPISAKKGGGDLARHILFFVKIVYSRGILKNRDKYDF